MTFFKIWQIFRLLGVVLFVIGLIFFGNTRQAFSENNVVIKLATLVPEGTCLDEGNACSG